MKKWIKKRGDWSKRKSKDKRKEIIKKKKKKKKKETKERIQSGKNERESVNTKERNKEKNGKKMGGPDLSDSQKKKWWEGKNKSEQTMMYGILYIYIYIFPASLYRLWGIYKPKILITTLAERLGALIHESCHLSMRKYALIIIMATPLISSNIRQ